MHRIGSALVAFALAVMSAIAVARDLPGPTEVIVQAPAGHGPFPAVVLGSGQGYHMDQPAMKGTADALVRHGFVVFRFNWTYWSQQPRGQPSPDLSRELADMQRVVASARTDPRVDAARISVGGKSLGSLVAWRALRADPSLVSAILLTPVAVPTTVGNQRVGDAAADVMAANYPDLPMESRPLLFVVGDRDPLCRPQTLLKFAGSAPGPVRVSVVTGDHGFEEAQGDAVARAAALSRSLRSVEDAVVSFMTQAPAPPTTR